jgi:catechol 2,3-dioxygenase-like lactoylglutathione lyase family enzyme
VERGSKYGVEAQRKMVRFARAVIALSTLAVMVSTVPAHAQAVGHVTGVGGIFVKSKDPKALAAWYRDVLGIDIMSWGGATLHYDAPGHPPVLAWSAFSEKSTYMAPSTRDFMIDFAVDDMDAIIARLTAKGVPILKRDDKDPSGKFAWILDPDGTKIELWQPK